MRVQGSEKEHPPRGNSPEVFLEMPTQIFLSKYSAPRRYPLEKPREIPLWETSGDTPWRNLLVDPVENLRCDPLVDHQVDLRCDLL